MAESSISSSNIHVPIGARPSLSGWLMPSISDLLFIAIVSTLLFTPLSIKMLNDAGIGWHIRTGQLIVRTHEVPRSDPFSSQVGQPWFAWEWFYDVMVGELEAWAGLNGVVWFTAVIIGIVFSWTFGILIARGTDLFNAVMLTLLAIGASMIHFLTRPHVFSWLFVVSWFSVLESTDPVSARGARWRLWLLPPSMLFWVNIHGGFLLGFVLLLAYWIGSLWTWTTLNSSRIEDALQKIAAGIRVRELTLVGAASIVATLANPYGWRLHEHIIGYLSNRFLMAHIEEFQSPNFHDIAPQCFLILLLVTFALAIAKGRQLSLRLVLLLLFGVYSGLYAARNIPISSILLVLITGSLLPTFGMTEFFQRMRSVNATLRGHLWPVVGTIVTFIIVAHGGRIGSHQWVDAHFDPHRMPVDAVNYIQSTGFRGPVLSPDYWGGYLIYRLYPRNSVVVDDRHDFYSGETIYGGQFLKSYLTMMHVEPGWEKFLNWHSDCILLPQRSALAAVLRKTPEWKLVYADDTAAIFIPAKEREDFDLSSQ